MAYESGWDELMRQGAKTMSQTIKSIVAGVGESIGAAIKAFGEVSAAPESRSASSEGFMSRMKDIMGLSGDSNPSQAPSIVREPEIKIASQQCKNYADPAELGCMAPPPLPLQVARGGAAIGNVG